jgi:hypothetical protein
MIEQVPDTHRNAMPGSSAATGVSSDRRRSLARRSIPVASTVFAIEPTCTRPSTPIGLPLRASLVPAAPCASSVVQTAPCRPCSFSKAATRCARSGAACSGVDSKAATTAIARSQAGKKIRTVIAIACAGKVIKQTLWETIGEIPVNSGGFPPADASGNCLQALPLAKRRNVVFLRNVQQCRDDQTAGDPVQRVSAAAP